MRLNPFNKSNPMSWKDAAKVSAVLTATTFFTTYVGLPDVPAIQADPVTWTIGAGFFIAKVFLTNFVALTGLAAYMAKREGS